MKTNFKKTLAVLLAVLMLTSVFSVTAFAATYTVTYKPGEGVEGQEYKDSFSRNIKIRNATYTREHYTQIGWATKEGESVVPSAYKFGATYKEKRNVTLYPVWKGDVYSFTYAPGQYANETESIVEEANYGATKALRGEIFTRDDYVQIGWSLEDGGSKVYELNGISGIIEGDVVLYPCWAQMYEIKFVPGQYGEGEEVSMLVEAGKTFSTKYDIFTREGYHQLGWSLEDGGIKLYDLLQDQIIADKDMVFYPYWVKDIYDLEVSVDELYFGEVCEDYTAPESKTFTVTNTGNVPVNLVVSGLSNYTVDINGSLLLNAGESITVTIQPKAGLDMGDYSETITFTTVEETSIIKDVDVAFFVSEHVFGTYKPDNNATYTSDGTKTAECVKGCGTKDVVADTGSKKVYSADNNDAAGLASSYIHHRTVRFTAYGSGMDAAENDNLTKRFRPVSWYVDEEFNGEFTGNQFEKGYEVTFTHTIFGKYTLVINYVEEELDEATGEWVATDVTDTKTFEYTVGTTAEEEQEIVRPNTILNIIFGLFAELLKLLGIGG